MKICERIESKKGFWKQRTLLYLAHDNENGKELWKKCLFLDSFLLPSGFWKSVMKIKRECPLPRGPFLTRRAKRAGDFFRPPLPQNPYKPLHFFTFLTRRAKRTGEEITNLSRNPYKTLHFFTSPTRRAKRAGDFLTLWSQNPYKTLHFFTFLTRRAKRARGKFLPFCLKGWQTLFFT